MIKRFIDSIAIDKKDHVLLGIIIGFPLVFFFGFIGRLIGIFLVGAMITEITGLFIAEVYPFEATRDCFKTLTQYTIGGNSVSVNHKDNGTGGSTDNVTNLVFINNISPDVNRNIDISVLGMDTGTNDFGHLNVLEITEKLA